ncbi:Uma2 family endonuclease [Moorena producens]|uniref:Uma2 family endonuclease n=1 Tax=Moorena producens TaxID=1155739 RepID=UPI003C722C16
MLKYDPLQYLPTSEELPSSDNTPVDNELQDLIPHLLKAILSLIWQQRYDWFFGIDMGYYYHPNQSAIVPDAFLSLGVDRRKIRPKGRQGRLSYVLWEENNTVPILAIENVSQTYNGEYDQKKLDYAELGFLYYLIYDGDSYYPRKGEPFEVHRLVDGVYVRQSGNPVWMPEIGLGIGTELGTYQDWSREWLYWYDLNGKRYPSPEERTEQAELEAAQERQRAIQAELEASQERQRAIQAEQRAAEAEHNLDALKAQLKQLGINPEDFMNR